MNCAGWNPVNFSTNINNTHILHVSKWKKEIEWNGKIEEENELFQKFCYERPF